MDSSTRSPARRPGPALVADLGESRPGALAPVGAGIAPPSHLRRPVPPRAVGSRCGVLRERRCKRSSGATQAEPAVFGYPGGGAPPSSGLPENSTCSPRALPLVLVVSALRAAFHWRTAWWFAPSAWYWRRRWPGGVVGLRAGQRVRGDGRGAAGDQAVPTASRARSSSRRCAATIAGTVMALYGRSSGRCAGRDRSHPHRLDRRHAGGDHGVRPHGPGRNAGEQGAMPERQTRAPWTRSRGTLEGVGPDPDRRHADRAIALVTCQRAARLCPGRRGAHPAAHARLNLAPLA